MPLSTTKFDAAVYLDTPEALAAFIDDAFESGDAAIIADALGVVARAGNLSSLARDAGLHRQTLYKTFATGGNPELGTVVKLLQALGLRLTAKPMTSAKT